MRTAGRLLRFSAVGAPGLGYMTATAIAVETAILHNFVWNSRWTWRDRSQGLPARQLLLRLLRLHLTSGTVARPPTSW